MFDISQLSAGLLFDTSGFPPRWQCGQWSSLLGWLHISSDVLIWGAYMAIPIVIVSFVLRRPDVPFPRVFWLFGAFIVACGSTHLIEASIFWWPNYRLSALAKILTALVSWLTVVALIRTIPLALRLPGLESVNLQLQQANTDLEDFAHVVSHDLKAPLRGIRRLSEWIDDDLSSASTDTREKLIQLQHRVDKMDRLINDVLEYSGIARNTSIQRTVPVIEVLNEVMLSLTGEQRNRIRIQGALPELRGNETQLHQIFQNLLENALRYCDADSGAVRISVVSGNRFHTFCIEDNGPGIDPQSLQRVFRLFHTSETENPAHSGIGLAIVKRCVERNGGVAWVESTLGAGCRFYFTWPN
ncbi:MAG: HAMP domain-containing histidine kinase [Candidatus Hydrogenedentes bacterium]|nr:HAMP domain-containing histidine kinase [Candidatus Hydrogenedentota bacterium]